MAGTQNDNELQLIISGKVDEALVALNKAKSALTDFDRASQPATTSTRQMADAASLNKREVVQMTSAMSGAVASTTGYNAEGRLMVGVVGQLNEKMIEFQRGGANMSALLGGLVAGGAIMIFSEGLKVLADDMKKTIAASDETNRQWERMTTEHFSRQLDRLNRELDKGKISIGEYDQAAGRLQRTLSVGTIDSKIAQIKEQIRSLNESISGPEAKSLGAYYNTALDFYFGNTTAKITVANSELIRLNKERQDLVEAAEIQHQNKLEDARASAWAKEKEGLYQLSESYRRAQEFKERAVREYNLKIRNDQLKALALEVQIAQLKVDIAKREAAARLKTEQDAAAQRQAIMASMMAALSYSERAGAISHEQAVRIQAAIDALQYAYKSIAAFASGNFWAGAGYAVAATMAGRVALTSGSGSTAPSIPTPGTSTPGEYNPIQDVGAPSGGGPTASRYNATSAQQITVNLTVATYIQGSVYATDIDALIERAITNGIRASGGRIQGGL
jgi:hypothetical protein